MKSLILVAALVLSGCIVAPEPYYTVYPVGYYNPTLGYWDGFRWDVQFYSYGHRGYGHRYFVPHGHYRR